MKNNRSWLGQGCRFLLLAGLFLETSAVPALAADGPMHFDGKQVFEVRGLTKDQIKEIGAQPAAKGTEAPLSVYVINDKGETAKTPLDGTSTLENGVLRFRARFPLEPGMTYRAIFQPGGLNSKSTPFVQNFVVAKKPNVVATTITVVYPTQDILPENLLKFYLHFSAPMSRGEVYRRVHLLSETGQAVDLPFLQLDQELWDARQQRFTLFFDPGRIKRGLRPREEAGPVLEEGKRYTFVIDADWPDAEGNPLGKGYRKSFRAGPPDEQRVDMAQWKITAPRAGDKQPLKIQFPKAMDHALAEHLIWIETASGERIAGVSKVTDKEHGWEFQPRANWAAGDYRIAVDTAFEDLAGNSVARAFEVDVLHAVEKKVEAKISYLPFAVR